MSVLDASAMLAFLQGEDGTDQVEATLVEGAVAGAANWSEVAQKVRAGGGDWGLASALLRSYDLQIEPVTMDDAEWAAQRWRAGEGLSLGDRLCLALGRRLAVDVVTADRSWGSEEGIVQIR